MNEITRIHIAKTSYDIEVTAKKQLEKYLHSLKVYTQDEEVLQDIEIRIVELLADRGVKEGGVIDSKDIASVRAQLGEPHEFAEDADIAVGSQDTTMARRYYRSTDDAILGGVLSGAAAYFSVNPLWIRLAFVIFLFVSFGTASLIYILFWVFTPPARTATEKLQLLGKNVTVESIKAFNDQDELQYRSKLAPVVQRVLAISLGIASGLASIGVLLVTISIVAVATMADGQFTEMITRATTVDMTGWVSGLVLGFVIAGLLLLSALFGIISYAFFSKSLTKRMIITSIVIVVLGCASLATVIGIMTTQSWRTATETRRMVRETNVALPVEFSTVSNLTFSLRRETTKHDIHSFNTYPSVRYVVASGTPRYELTSLPSTNVGVKVEGQSATIELVVPDGARNSFVRPTLTVYGPALKGLSGNNLELEYSTSTQDTLSVVAHDSTAITLNGSYGSVEVSGSGSVDASSGAISALTVTSNLNLSVSAGTVRDLTITQPEVCPGTVSATSTSVAVVDVTSKKMTYNGRLIDATPQETSCAQVTIGTPSTE